MRLGMPPSPGPGITPPPHMTSSRSRRCNIMQQQHQPAKIVRVMHSLEEEAYIVETPLHAAGAGAVAGSTTTTIIKALEFTEGAGDTLEIVEVRPHKVPPHVVITETSLANEKFSARRQEECQDLAQKLDRQLHLNQTVGQFVLESAKTLARQPSSSLGTNQLPPEQQQQQQRLPAVADCLESRLSGLVEQESQLLQEKRNLYRHANKLDGNALLVKVVHTSSYNNNTTTRTDGDNDGDAAAAAEEPATVQLWIHFRKPNTKSTFSCEYRYSSETQSASFRQFFCFDSPLEGHQNLEEIAIYGSSKLPPSNPVPPTSAQPTPRISVSIENGHLHHRPRVPRAGAYHYVRNHLLVARHSNVVVSPGPNLVEVVDCQDLEIRYEAFPTQCPDRVFAMGEIWNKDWGVGKFLELGGYVHMFRDNVLVQSHLSPLPPQCLDGSFFVPCGVEPKIAVDFTTDVTRTGAESPRRQERPGNAARGDGAPPSTATTAFLDVTHKARVTSEFPCAVRIHLSVPEIHRSDDPTALVVMGVGDGVAATKIIQEFNRDFADPPASEETAQRPTLHILGGINDPGFAVLRVVAPGDGAMSPQATFSYQIQWQQKQPSGSGGGGTGNQQPQAPPVHAGPHVSSPNPFGPPAPAPALAAPTGAGLGPTATTGGVPATTTAGAPVAAPANTGASPPPPSWVQNPAAFPLTTTSGATLVGGNPQSNSARARRIAGKDLKKQSTIKRPVWGGQSNSREFLPAPNLSQSGNAPATATGTPTTGAPAPPTPTSASTSVASPSLGAAPFTVAARSPDPAQKRTDKDSVDPAAFAWINTTTSGATVVGGELSSSNARARLVEFYLKYNSINLKKVDDILAKNRGNEKAMFLRLARKYNVDPSEVDLVPVAKMNGTVVGSPPTLNGAGASSSPVLGRSVVESPPASSGGAVSSLSSDGQPVKHDAGPAGTGLGLSSDGTNNSGQQAHGEHSSSALSGNQGNDDVNSGGLKSAESEFNVPSKTSQQKSGPHPLEPNKQK